MRRVECTIPVIPHWCALPYLSFALPAVIRQRIKIEQGTTDSTAHSAHSGAPLRPRSESGCPMFCLFSRALVSWRGAVGRGGANDL